MDVVLSRQFGTLYPQRPDFTVQPAPEAPRPQIGKAEEMAGASATTFAMSADARALQAAAIGLRRTIERNLDVDPRTREIVVKFVDRSNGEILRQTPTEASLRLRAYVRGLLSDRQAPAMSAHEA